MSAQPIDQYLTLDFFKKMIQSTDDQDDDLLSQHVNDANGKVQTALFRYVDKTPLEPGSPQYSRAGDAALSYARYLRAIDLQQIEKSKSYIEQYNMELYGAGGTEGNPMAGGLIQELISTRNTRTRTVMITVDPRENKVPLPTQNDIFVFDEFA